MKNDNEIKISPNFEVHTIYDCLSYVSQRGNQYNGKKITEGLTKNAIKKIIIEWALKEVNKNELCDSVLIKKKYIRITWTK